ncbi:MAG: sigma-70 family RNA polymerase sigma factor [Gemmataceae bacterium]|nr:sigma-70 family RNA polymerase sigma factor [Gemmataceae bacterium]
MAVPPRLVQHVRRLMSAPADESASDAALLERFIRTRDQDAFASLVARHGPMVLGVCRRLLGDLHAADDAFQATFLVLARKAGSIRPRDALAGWLYGVARRVALKAQSVARRQRELPDQPDPRPNPLDQLSARELLHILDEAIERLPQSYRLPILLCCLEGKTQEEAARQLGWSPGSVKGRLERGRARLHALLAKRGLALSAALAAVEISNGAANAGNAAFFAEATVRTALAFATGYGSAPSGSMLSADVTGLAEVALKEMTMTKSKTLLAMLLGVIAVTSVGLVLAHQAPDERSAAKPSALVQADADDKPEQEKPVATEGRRVDLYGDPLPPGANARLGTLRFRAPDEADALAFAPDGKTIAVSSRGGVYLFDAVSGKRIKRMGAYMYPGRLQDSLAFSPDGKRLALWGKTFVNDDTKGLRVWELPGDGKLLEHDVKHVLRLAWSADSQPLAVCLEKGAVSLHEVASGRSRRFECENLQRPELSDFVLCAFVPTAQTLAFADDQNTIHVWDTARSMKRCTVPKNKDDIRRAVALSPDGRHLATLRQEHASPYRHAVEIWDAATGTALRTMAADHKNMSTLGFSPDGKTLATAGWNGIRFWEVATGKETSRSQSEGANTEKIAFSADGQTLATLQRHSGAFHVWDVNTGKQRDAPLGHLSRPYGIAFSPDGRRLATGSEGDGTIHVWDLTTSKSLFNIHRPGYMVRRLAFSRDCRWLFATWASDELWISEAATGKRHDVIKLEDPERPDTYQSAWSMHLSTDGKRLVALSHYYPKKNDGPRYDDTLITGWDATTRKLLFRRRLAGTESWNAVSDDARLLAAAYPSRKSPGQGPMRLEPLASGESLLNFPELEGQTWPLAFSRDGRLLASNNYNYKLRKEGDPNTTGANLVLWEVATAAEVLSLPLAGQYRAAFSPDGRLLAMTAPVQDIVVWDLARGEEFRRFTRFDAVVSSLAFSPDGRQLISALGDSTLLLWDVGLPPALKGKMGAETLPKAWADLAGSDGPRAFQARWTLVGAPEGALALLKRDLKPAQPADPKRLRKLIEDLDSQQFAIRTAANKQLEELGDLASGALRQALSNTSLELRRRAQALLDKLRGPITQPEMMRAVRAVAVLEDIANADARKLLETLARGAPDARLTQEALDALRRLDKQ